MSGTHILLIEDDPAHQKLLRGVLAAGRANVRVSLATTGAEACRLIRDRKRAHFDCVVADFNLEQVDAAELIPRLHAAGCRCPVIVISSDGAQRIVIKSLRSGGVDFLPKLEAFQGDYLWSRIDVAVAEGRKKEETRRKITRRAKHLARLAQQDPLTGLSNRRCVVRLFQKRRSVRDRRGKTAILMIDIDRFKHVNDTYGHIAGDRVLCSVANAIYDQAAEQDTVCRYGGEEFLAVRSSTTDAQALQWAESIRAGIENLAVSVPDHELSVTVSVGLACLPSDAVTPQSICLADRAMYLAKERGRNRVCTWEMVAIRDELQGTRPETVDSVESRLARLIESLADRLGPTTRAHLTTHSQYVSRLAVRLGLALKFDERNLERLRLAGLLHDIGKCVIPEATVAKPASLTPEEAALMAVHNEEGADMARLLGADEITSEYIRHHHTRFEDIESQASLFGRSVPLGAGILAVADALVTMTSHRSYQEGRSFTAATRELQRERGRQFDPDVVDAVPHALLENPPPNEVLQHPHA